MKLSFRFSNSLVRLSDSFADSLIRGGRSILSSFKSFSLLAIHTPELWLPAALFFSFLSAVIIVRSTASYQDLGRLHLNWLRQRKAQISRRRWVARLAARDPRHIPAEISPFHDKPMTVEMADFLE